MSSNGALAGPTLLDFLSKVDHDIRAHLHSVTQEIERARIDGLDHEVAGCLARIDDAVAHATYCLERLRVRSHVMPGLRQALRMVPMTPGHLVNSMRRIGHLARNGSQREIEISETLAEISHRTLTGDRRLIELALLRIVKCACAAAASGPVRVHFSDSRRGEVLIRVEYFAVLGTRNGSARDRLEDFAGMPEEVVPEIEAIVMAHRGKVRVHLEPETSSAQCLLWLPLNA